MKSQVIGTKCHSIEYPPSFVCGPHFELSQSKKKLIESLSASTFPLGTPQCILNSAETAWGSQQGPTASFLSLKHAASW